jgi:hypothetical protein
VVSSPSFQEVGLHQCPSEKKSDGEPACGQHAPSHVPTHAHTAAKVRAFSPKGLEFIAEKDSALEESGFELAVPPDGERGRARYDRRYTQGREAQAQVPWSAPILLLLLLGLPFHGTWGVYGFDGRRLTALGRLEGTIQPRSLHDPLDDNPPHGARRLAPTNSGERPQRCGLFRNRMFYAEALETPAERLPRGYGTHQSSPPGLRSKAAAIAERSRRDRGNERVIVKL